LKNQKIRRLLLVLLLYSTKNDAQTPDSVSQKLEFRENMPQFPGGDVALNNYLKANYVVPNDAIKANINGRVVSEFIVEKDGRITHVRIIKSIFPSVDSTVVVFLENMPNWIPGNQNGVPVRVRMNYPILISTSSHFSNLYFKNHSNTVDSFGAPPKKIPKIGQGASPAIGFYTIFPTKFIKENFTKFNGIYFDFKLYPNNNWSYGAFVSVCAGKSKVPFSYKGTIFPEKTAYSYGNLGLEGSRFLFQKNKLSMSVFTTLGYSVIGLTTIDSKFNFLYFQNNSGIFVDIPFSNNKYFHKYRGIVQETWGVRLRFGASPHIGTGSAKSELVFNFGALLNLKSRTLGIPESWKKG
jgi:hypothetical protein